MQSCPCAAVLTGFLRLVDIVKIVQEYTHSLNYKDFRDMLRSIECYTIHSTDFNKPFSGIGTLEQRGVCLAAGSTYVMIRIFMRRELPCLLMNIAPAVLHVFVEAYEAPNMFNKTDVLMDFAATATTVRQEYQVGNVLAQIFESVRLELCVTQCKSLVLFDILSNQISQDIVELRLRNGLWNLSHCPSELGFQLLDLVHPEYPVSYDAEGNATLLSRLRDNRKRRALTLQTIKA